MSEPGMELVVPGVGEIVPLDDPLAVAKALQAARELEYQIRSAKTELVNALVYASQVAGTKTLHLEGLKATIKPGDETVYDAEAIEVGLREAGMPEASIREIVVEQVSYKVDAVRAKRAAGANPVYGEIIEAHKRVEKKAASVTISMGRS